MQISLIAAMADNRTIGMDNRMPWHLPADLRHFKSLTLGKPVIMGRKTFESLGKPLPQRLNIVITRDPFFKAEGCEVVNSLKQALNVAENSNEAMIIGGAQIYQQALPLAQRIYLTEVHEDFRGDSFFPELNRREWQETGREDHLADEKNAFDYSFVILERKPSSVHDKKSVRAEEIA